MRFFDPKLARRMDDSVEVSLRQDSMVTLVLKQIKGFFSVYRSLFTLLASDEALHTLTTPLHYPSFGYEDTSYAPPSGMTKAQRDAIIWARDFYTVWSEFTSEKRFDWVAKWDVERGDDRGMRRLMEKENKRVREEYRKEYNDTVRVNIRTLLCMNSTDKVSNLCSSFVTGTLGIKLIRRNSHKAKRLAKPNRSPLPGQLRLQARS